MGEPTPCGPQLKELVWPTMQTLALSLSHTEIAKTELDAAIQFFSLFDFFVWVSLCIRRRVLFAVKWAPNGPNRFQGGTGIPWVHSDKCRSARPAIASLVTIVVFI